MATDETDYEDVEDVFDIEQFRVHENGHFSDVCGLQEIKYKFMERIILPFRFPSLFNNRLSYGNINLFGASGVGKTCLALAVMGEIPDVPCYYVSMKQLLERASGGVVTRMIRSLGSSFIRQNRAALIVDDFHHVDSSMRQLYLEFVNIQWSISKVNHLNWLIFIQQPPYDCVNRRAIRRAAYPIYIPLPDSTTRQELVTKHLKGLIADLSTDDICHLALLTQGYPGADIIQVALTLSNSKSSNELSLQDVIKYLENNAPHDFSELEEKNIKYREEYDTEDVSTLEKGASRVRSLQQECCEVIVNCMNISKDTSNKQLLDNKLPLPRALRLMVTQRAQTRLGRL